MLRNYRPTWFGACIVFIFFSIFIIPTSSFGAVENNLSSTADTLNSLHDQGINLAGVTSTGELILALPEAAVQGIAGTGLRGIAGTGLRGIAGTGLRTTTFEPIPLASVGQISSITDNSPTQIVINGQVISLDNVSTIISIADNKIETSSGENASTLLSIGDYVAVAGEIIDSGHQLATYLVKLSEPYTAGSSPIYIRAKLDSNPNEIGSVYSGATQIDQSNALYDDHISQVTSGQTVEYIGYSYDSNPNKFFATSGRQIASTSGIAGTGLRGIAGTGLRGIAGTGLRGIAGTGLRGIAGTGLRGIAGTGLRGIAGTGLR